jgi:predicted TIM-barrel fold metal-dependent hydrolase
MDFSVFANILVIDGHVHFVHPERLTEILALFTEAHISRCHLVSLPNPDTTTHNPAALYFKQKYPDRVYISGALDYSVLADPSHAPDRLAAQIATLKEQGFDGLKLIEGKPQVRKLLPHRLDGALYEKMWAVLEQEAFPVVLHVNDPDEFWDAACCPDWARQNGWDYSDGSFPSKEDLYTEVDNILARYPCLKITLAHFYFLSRDLDRAASFLDGHPTICFDLAPHMDMYHDFSRKPETAHDFFIRYQDRIIYGTDIDTRTLERGAYSFMRFIPWLIRSMLERDDTFSSSDGISYHGLGLPREVLEKIYCANFERVYGNHPALLKQDEY